MMHRINYTNTAAMDLQSAAELRRSQATAASTIQQPGAQYNFAEIFGGPNWGAQEAAVARAPVAAIASRAGLHTEIAAATAVVESPTESAATDTLATTATTSSATAAATSTTPGVQALVSAIMDGSFQPTYETDASKLQEITPIGTDYMPSFYYASDQTAAQLAQLLGGTVVKMTAFGQDKGWTEPDANFIQLQNGQTFNAADVAYYAKTGSVGVDQLTADITATINQGSAWTNYYQQGGAMPSFAPGYIGPPISGSSYDVSMINSSTGDVINPAMQQSGVKGT